MNQAKLRALRQKAPVVAVLLGGLTTLFGADWPQYRGPNGDGGSPETIRTNWAEQAPRVVWRKPIGQGFSSMAITGGRVFTQAKRAPNIPDRELCIALDTETGNELWRVDVGAADYTDLAGYDNRMDGPRSTPTVDGDRVYVFTSQLKLYCLRAEDGRVVWTRDFRAELGSTLIAWENAASPLLAGELIFINANARGQRLLAVRKSDGTTAWSGQDDTMTHSTPVFAHMGDAPQVIFLTRLGLVSVVPESGTVLWRLAFSPSATSTAASPVVIGNYVHASSAYGSGTYIARVAKNSDVFTATQSSRQQGNAYQLHWSTPVHHDGFLYCIPSPTSAQARLACLDVAAGTNRWTQTVVGSDRIGYGSLIKAANTLIVLTETGELVLVEPKPAEYSELARFKVLDRYCWNHVALANGRMYARSTSQNPEIVAIDVAAGVTPLPAIALAAERITSGGVKLTVHALDGTSLDATHGQRLQLQSTTDLNLPASQWSPLDLPFTAVDGTLVTELPVADGQSHFLRVREKPGTN